MENNDEHSEAYKREMKKVFEHMASLKTREEKDAYWAEFIKKVNEELERRKIQMN